jgi:hypothetical protein
MVIYSKRLDEDFMKFVEFGAGGKLMAAEVVIQ